MTMAKKPLIASSLYSPIQPQGKIDSFFQSTVKVIQGEWKGLASQPGVRQESRFLAYYDKIKDCEHGVDPDIYPEDFAFPGETRTRGLWHSRAQPTRARATRRAQAPRERATRVPTLWE